MADVFISYAHKDRAIAESVCEYLESRYISCWYAPRNVSMNTTWAEEITSAIQHVKIFLFIFSANSNTSNQVVREIALATKYRKPIVPFFIDNTQMNETLEYYLTSVHWIDGMNPPIQERIFELYKYVNSKINDAKRNNGLDKSSGRSPVSIKNERKKQKTGKIIVVLICCVAVVAGVIIYLMVRSNTGLSEMIAKANKNEQESAGSHMTFSSSSNHSIPTLRLDRTILNGYSGKSYTINATTTGITSDIEWKSSDPDVASVDNGIVTGNREGNATITAKAEGLESTCYVSILKPFIVLGTSSKTLSVGDVYYIVNGLYGLDQVVWESSDNDVASVDEHGVITANSPGEAIIFVSANGISAECTIVVQEKTGISDNQLIMSVGDTKILGLNGTEIADTSSEDETIATVDKDGMIVARKTGKTIVTLKGEDGYLYTCNLTVVEGDGISESEIILEPNKEKKINLFGTELKGLATEDANVAFADVDGTITAQGIGETVVSFIGENDKQYDCIVKVEREDGINLKRMTLQPGHSGTLSLYGTAIMGASTDEISVAEVKSDGTVEAKKEGRAKIVLTGANGKEYKCIVTVEDKSGLNEEEMILPADGSKILRLYGNTVKGIRMDDVDIASINKYGIVTGHSDGTTSISLTDLEGNEYTCLIRVQEDYDD